MSRILPFRSMALAAVVLAVATPAAGPAAARCLELDRAAVLSGQVWRLLTGHLVHAGREHLLWDVLPLIVVGFLFEEYLGRRFWKVLAASMMVVGGGLVLVDAGLPTYRGLSGVLNGLWVAGALAGARAEAAVGNRALARLYRLAVLLDLGKVAVETATGVPLFTDPSRLGARPVPLSHALGFVAGLLSGFPRPEDGRPASRRWGILWTARDLSGGIVHPLRPSEDSVSWAATRSGVGPRSARQPGDRVCPRARPWYRSTWNGGSTWTADVRLSDLASGAPYKSANGYAFPYGDYHELSVDSNGRNHVIWGEGASYTGPGGSWYTRGQ